MNQPSAATIAALLREAAAEVAGPLVNLFDNPDALLDYGPRGDLANRLLGMADQLAKRPPR